MEKDEGSLFVRVGCVSWFVNDGKVRIVARQSLFMLWLYGFVWFVYRVVV